MNTNKRVFVAAWEYPPLISGESVVCRRSLEHSVFDYDLCCGPIETKGDEHIRIFPVGGNKYLSWPFAVAKKFHKLQKKEPYSVMMSRVMPPNGHLAGWLIKKRHPQVKWIAYFSDPVWNSPFLKASIHNDGSHRPKWLVMKLFGIPCRWALRDADVLMFNNDRLARFVLGRRFAQFQDKILIAPYGHEGVFPRPFSQRENGRICLTHVGQIYGNRTFSALIEGLSILQKEQPRVYETLKIRQVGFVCEAERERVKKSSVADCFTFVATVPYKESIEEMYHADCLLVIDPCFDRAEKNLYIAGKFFDYLSTGRPVLCLAEKDGATGDGAREWGCLQIDPNGQAVAKGLAALSHSLEIYDSSKYSRASCTVGIEKMDNILAFCIEQPHKDK